jgi:hypothetical protein
VSKSGVIVSLSRLIRVNLNRLKEDFTPQKEEDDQNDHPTFSNFLREILEVSRSNSV